MTMMTMPKTAAPARPPKPERRKRRRYTLLPDPPKKKIDMLHNQTKNDIQTTLRNHYRNDATTLVGGEGYLVLTPADLNGHAVPDCVVAFGVEADAVIREGNGYVVREVGKPPDVVIEVASPTTGVRDYTVKRQIYRDVGAGEFWRFDHTGGRYHDAPLAGDILVDGEYRRVKIHARPDGTFWGYSPALDLYLVWQSGDLRFYDPNARRFLPTTPEYAIELDEAVRDRDEAVRSRDEAVRDREEERAARIESDRRAAEERQRAEESDRRAAEAEAELERLRRLLAGSE